MRVECVWLEDKSVAYTRSVRLLLCKEWSQWICQCHTTWNILRNLRTKYSVLTTYLTEGRRPCKYKQSVCGGVLYGCEMIFLYENFKRINSFVNSLFILIEMVGPEQDMSVLTVEFLTGHQALLQISAAGFLLSVEDFYFSWASLLITDKCLLNTFNLLLQPL